MIRLISIAVAVIVILAGASVFALFGWRRAPQESYARQTSASEQSAEKIAPMPESVDETATDVLISARRAQSAPALQNGTWLNSEPLTIEGLKGRVVVVDFWTFGCYNCRNTLPAVKRWDATYREQGLTIIGVHTPEFDREKNLQNVREQVRALGILYPVLTDNENQTWDAYGVHAWPTVIILDKQGRIRWTHIGEGLYAEQENVIKKLLAE